jgi:hypothetical protein
MPRANNISLEILGPRAIDFSALHQDIYLYIVRKFALFLLFVSTS